MRVTYGVPFEVGQGDDGLAEGVAARFRRSRTELPDCRMARGGDSHRVVRWLWTSRRPDARLARLALLPAAACGGRHGREGVGLSAGLAPGARSAAAVRGRRAISPWVDRARRRSRSGSRAYYAARGLGPGILLRGYGNDEVLVHQHAVPEAQVIADPDRAAGAERALATGAQVLVLDDAYQRLDVRRDLNIAVVSAETSRAVRWPLPAGPWREAVAALGAGRCGGRDPEAGDARRPPSPWRTSVPTRIRGRSPSPIWGCGTLEGMVSGIRRPASEPGREAGGGGVRHRRSGRLRGPDEGDRRGGAGGHLERPS